MRTKPPHAITGATTPLSAPFDRELRRHPHGHRRTKTAVHEPLRVRASAMHKTTDYPLKVRRSNPIVDNSAGHAQGKVKNAKRIPSLSSVR